jgi:hypothetical protein
MKTIFLLAVALFLLGFGWVLAIDQNRAWRWHEKGARHKGLSTDSLERTDERELGMAWRGFFFMALGVLTLMAALCNA